MGRELTLVRSDIMEEAGVRSKLSKSRVRLASGNLEEGGSRENVVGMVGIVGMVGMLLLRVGIWRLSGNPRTLQRVGVSPETSTLSWCTHSI